MTASGAQEELTVLEATLDDAVQEEGFLREGSGSAFVSRPNTVVVVRCSERGAGLARRKVEQLVERGFHGIVLTLEDAGAPKVAATGLRAAAEYAEAWGAWLAVVAPSGLRGALAAEGGLPASAPVVGDRAAALEAYRRREEAGDAGGEVDPLVVASGDALADSGDATYDPNDWGWGEPAPAAAAAPAKLDVAELFVQADELGGLGDQIRGVTRRGRRYVTLRLHFPRDRRLSSDDVRHMTAARDALTKAGGQLVLAALQEDVLKWLRLLDEERKFLIVETADDAERAHARHAAGEAPAPVAPAADEPAFVVASRDGDAVVMAPRAGGAGGERAADVVVIDLGRDGIPGLPGRVEALAARGAQRVVVDLSRFRELRGERFDALPGAAAAAQAAGVELVCGGASSEVRALLRILGLDGEGVVSATLDDALGALAAREHARSPFARLRLRTRREALLEPPPADPLTSSSFLVEDEPAPRPAPPVAPAAGATDARAQAELTRLQAELARAHADLARARADAEAAQRQASEAGAQRERVRGELAELEQRVRQEERKRHDAEQAAQRAERKLETARLAAEEAEGARRALEASLAGAEQRAAAAEQRAAAAEERAGAAAGAAEASLAKERDAARAEADGARARVRELEGELKQARAAGAAASAGGEDLGPRVAELERANARILAEAQEEIERLLAERAALRDELESAGDMIERLGKELELS